MPSEFMYDRVGNSIKLGYALVLALFVLHLVTALMAGKFSICSASGLACILGTLALGYFGESAAIGYQMGGYTVEHAERIANKFFLFQIPLMFVSFSLWAFSI